MQKRKGNNGNHGAKGKSGRKPSAFTKLKRRIESEKEDDDDNKKDDDYSNYIG